MDARLVRLRVYPFKSLDGADVAVASLSHPAPSRAIVSSGSWMRRVPW